MQHFRCVEVPPLMQGLEKDHRGYPIPVVVQRDMEGKPHFAVNDERKRRQLIAQDRCSICGNRLNRGRWFVGGPLSAFHEHGAYMDPPLHAECMRYAMQVCPYLALPKYMNRIEESAAKALEIQGIATLIDNTQIAEKPELFVAIMAIGQSYSDRGSVIYVKPVRPYRQVEYWKDGVQLPADRGAIMAEEVMGMPVPERQTAKVYRRTPTLDPSGAKG